MEIWKDVENYEGIYWVSNQGRVKSKKQILNPIINKLGYSIVSICLKGTNKKRTVHSLVANAFIPNPNNYKEINHKDENKNNNNVSNLEWCTRKYNCNYGERNKKLKEKNGHKIIQIKNDGTIIEWESLIDIKRFYGKSDTPIRRRLKGKTTNPYYLESRWIYG